MVAPSRPAVVIALGVGAYLYFRKSSGPAKSTAEMDRDLDTLSTSLPSSNKKIKMRVDRAFFQRLLFLLKIIFPRLVCRESLLLTCHTASLVARTLLSIYIAQLDGRLVKTIVDKTPRLFLIELMKWLAISLPATFVNSMIRFFESKLALAFRTRLVNRLYTNYMQQQTYYRIGNLDSRLPNPDQCLTDDTAQFSTDLAHIYSQLSKPLLDVVLMTSQLLMLGQRKKSGNHAGNSPLALAALVIAVSGFVLRVFTPPFGKLIAEEEQRKGELRAAHSRVITHSEEIAFYGGAAVEESTLRFCYKTLASHMSKIYWLRVPYTMLEQFLMKYIWGATGLVMIALPTFATESGSLLSAFTGNEPATAAVSIAPSSSSLGISSVAVSSVATASEAVVETVSDRTENFITARSLLVSGADAIERIMSSWKDIQELTGRTARVYNMFRVFDEVAQEHYVKPRVLDDAAAADAAAVAPHAVRKMSPRDWLHSRGEVIDRQDVIECRNLPVVTPTGDVLIANPGLNFEIKRGMHLLITGPNGCGKSSLFRMIGGLWPIRGGTLRKPGAGDMFYIPQRPYLSIGCLRDQFIYPDTTEQMKVRRAPDGELWTDEKLMQILDVVDLKQVALRESKGLDEVKDWRDVLSGGEKQRVAMARLFYHMPKFAILDECTSQVSIDVEGRMYTYAKHLGISLLTVTHRPSLWKYHTHLLQFDGEGGYSFSELNASERLSLREEMTKLEDDLAKVPSQQMRLRELSAKLGETSKYLEDLDAQTARAASGLA